MYENRNTTYKLSVDNTRIYYSKNDNKNRLMFFFLCHAVSHTQGIILEALRELWNSTPRFASTLERGNENIKYSNNVLLLYFFVYKLAGET